MSDRDTHHAWAESVLALPYETLAARPFLLRDALIDAHADRAALRAALAAAAEKVGVLYAMYTAGTAFWNDEDGEIIVDAVWEARLVEADAVLSRALTAIPTDTHEP